MAVHKIIIYIVEAGRTVWVLSLKHVKKKNNLSHKCKENSRIVMPDKILHDHYFYYL